MSGTLWWRAAHAAMTALLLFLASCVQDEIKECIEFAKPVLKVRENDAYRTCTDGHPVCEIKHLHSENVISQCMTNKGYTQKPGCSAYNATCY
jgi:hypothetical protein